MNLDLWHFRDTRGLEVVEIALFDRASGKCHLVAQDGRQCEADRALDLPPLEAAEDEFVSTFSKIDVSAPWTPRTLGIPPRSWRKARQNVRHLVGVRQEVSPPKALY
jgi:hypothetical protein